MAFRPCRPAAQDQAKCEKVARAVSLCRSSMAFRPCRPTAQDQARCEKVARAVSLCRPTATRQLAQTVHRADLIIAHRAIAYGRSRNHGGLEQAALLRSSRLCAQESPYIGHRDDARSDGCLLLEAPQNRIAQRLNEFAAGYRGERGHADTATRWTPTKTVAAGFSTSRQSSMASLIRVMRTSSDFAWVWHPRSAGTDATKYPSSSFSITTLNSLFTGTLLWSAYPVTRDPFSPAEGNRKIEA